MKTCALYGVLNAIAAALLILVLYFLGYHSDVSKLPSAQWIGGIAGLAVGITVTTLGVRARRAEAPADKPFGYGDALLAGFLITVVTAILTSLFFYAYNAFINPGFADVIVQDAMDKAQARGTGGAQLEQMEKGVRWFALPAVQAVLNFIGTLLIGTLISLVVAIFVRRPASDSQPKAV